MKKFLLPFLTTVFIFIASSSNAQYKNAVGVRLGDAVGITYKTFIQSDRALDFILSLRSRRTALTGLYEIHNPINGAPGLRWYYGAGASIGSYNYRDNDRDDDSDLYVSADGVLGLDYVIPGSPLNLSLDWKPALVLTPRTDFDTSGVGLSIRIVL